MRPYTRAVVGICAILVLSATGLSHAQSMTRVAYVGEYQDVRGYQDIYDNLASAAEQLHVWHDNGSGWDQTIHAATADLLSFQHLATNPAHHTPRRPRHLSHSTKTGRSLMLMAFGPDTLFFMSSWVISEPG